MTERYVAAETLGHGHCVIDRKRGWVLAHHLPDAEAAANEAWHCNAMERDSRRLERESD